ncbi:MAG: DUF3857 domain-containing protein [Bacteroidales bacterium]|nr:DUF3857 domain-containing protein [Bacteroidales bacterium]
MKKQFYLLTLLVSLVTMSFGQTTELPEYNMRADSSLTELTDAENTAAAVILMDSRMYDYYNIPGGLQLTKTIYKNVRINEEKALDEFNKIAIPMGNVKKVVSLTARTISPDGTVVEMDQSKLKEMTNIEGYGNVKLFAIEGASVGGEIEYKYVLEMNPLISKTEIYQDQYPIRKGYFELKSPKKFRFSVKGFNGFPTVNDVGNKDIWLTATLNDIPALIEEEYATNRANLMKVNFALTKVEGTSTGGLTWSRVQDNVFSKISNFKSGDFSKANKIKKELGLEGMSITEKIEAIEDYLKTHFTYSRNAGSDLDDVFKTKQGDQLGMTRLFAIMFQKYEIPYVLVITSNRNHSVFDTEIPSFSDLDGILFSFFDNSNQYIDPTEVAFRYGIPPMAFADNNALMIVISVFPPNPYHQFGYINPAPADQNVSIKNIRLFLDEDSGTGIMESQNDLTGYRAFNAREVLAYADEDNKREYLKFLASSGFEEAEILDEEIINPEFSKSIHNQPFTYKCKVKSSDLVEKAGSDYIINVGKVIGKQSELYQEKERQQPIHMTQTMTYKYEIILDIPDGYIVENPDDVKISHILFEEGEATAQFVSDYELTDSQLIIRVTEMYTKCDFDISLYDAFREVINAASDFSKSKVLLSKNVDH